MARFQRLALDSCRKEFDVNESSFGKATLERAHYRFGVARNPLRRQNAWSGGFTSKNAHGRRLPLRAMSRFSGSQCMWPRTPRPIVPRRSGFVPLCRICPHFHLTSYQDRRSARSSWRSWRALREMCSARGTTISLRITHRSHAKTPRRKRKPIKVSNPLREPDTSRRSEAEPR